MILKSYLFSQVDGKYDQYTIDHSESFLKRLCNNSNISNQIAVHREGNLMYYSYVHKCANSQIHGFCIVCGEVCLDLRWLYDLFRDTLERAAIKGVIFFYDEKGHICKNILNFFSESAEVESLLSEIKANAEINNSVWGTLSSENYSLSKDSILRLSFENDDNEKIIESIRRYYNVIVTTNDTMSSSFSNKIRQISIEKDNLLQQNHNLKERIKKLDNIKKGSTWLYAFVFSLFIGIFFLSWLIIDKTQLHKKISDKNRSIEMLESANSNIKAELEKIISDQNDTIEFLNIENSNLSTELSDNKEFFDEIGKLMPIPVLVSDIEVRDRDGDYGATIYSSNTTYLYTRFKLYSLTEGYIDLYIKFIDEYGSLRKGHTSPERYSFKQSVYVDKYKSMVVDAIGWGNERKGNWSNGRYKVEVWYNDNCIGYKYFYVN